MYRVLEDRRGTPALLQPLIRCRIIFIATHCPYCDKAVLKSVGRPLVLVRYPRDHITRHPILPRSIFLVLTAGSSQIPSSSKHSRPWLASATLSRCASPSLHTHGVISSTDRYFPPRLKSTKTRLTPTSPVARKELTSFTNRSFCRCNNCPSGHQPGLWYSQGRRGGLTGEYRQHDCLRPQYDFRRRPHYHHHPKEGCGRCVSSKSFAFVILQNTQRVPPLAGRSEFRIFLLLYFISLPFQLLTTGAVLQQGSLALVVLTAIHAGIIVALFWTLLGNAIVSTQIVEDGTLSSLIVRLSPCCIHPPHITSCDVSDPQLTTLPGLAALVCLRPRFIRSYNLYLSGRGPIDNQHLRPVQPTNRSQQHPSFRSHQYLAWRVSN